MEGNGEFSQEHVIDPEAYRDKTVDIVHRGSLDRVIGGKKRASLETIQDARRIQQRIAALQQAGITMRFIDRQLVYEEPSIDQQVVVGGAFDKQCIAEYLQSAQKQGAHLQIDPLLTLRLD